MSANHSNVDGKMILPELKINKTVKSAIIETFEVQCDNDVDVITKDIETHKSFRKLAIIKTILFVPELTLTLIISGKKSAKFRFECQKIYWKLIRNKITITEFKKKLNQIKAD